MKISNLLNQDQVTLSFEVFPPKTSSTYESVAQATQEIAALRPDFMSVTYGAGGGTSEHTVHIASDLQEKYGVTVLTHLTCVSSTRAHVATMLEKFKQQGIENVLALRGDIPAAARRQMITTTRPSWCATSRRRAISASAARAIPRDIPSLRARMKTSCI